MKKCFLISFMLISILTQDPSIPPVEGTENNQSPSAEPTIPPNEGEPATDPSFLNETSPKTETPTNEAARSPTTSFKDLKYEFSFSVKPIDVVFISSIVLAILLIVATIASFCKVPLRKGYSCRGCQRFKWFFIIFLYLLFCPFLLVYYCINGIEGCLNGCFPDKKLEDCKLDEVPEPEPKPKPKEKKNNSGTYQDLVEEEKKQ